ncbi:MAG: hypothetical protein KatS3mg057_0478 [Herpetosiphonaceae bacterium]|nr:MAG: hypothetical protein KatS3mg057_0478 [Herpetosiphonaceae bacterium]
MARGLLLRVPTLMDEGSQLRQEMCYLTLHSSPTVAELIAEKVRAEFRKVQLGASADTTIIPLIGNQGPSVQDSKQQLEETVAILRAWEAFNTGQLTVLVDGVVARRLDQRLMLRRNSAVLFYPRAVVAAC